MSNVQQLRQASSQLVEIVSRLGTMIAAPTPPSASRMFDLRRELSSVLVDHLEMEDWSFYPRLIADGDPQIASIARKFCDEMGGLAAAYTIYSRRWDRMSIAAKWHGYCFETRDIVAALTTRIHRENRELYPLVEAFDNAACAVIDGHRKQAA